MLLKRNIFISGANSDIGIILAQKFLADGHNVIGHYREENSKFLDLEKTNQNFSKFQFDFSKSNNWEEEIKKKEKMLSKIDIFVHLAAELKSKNFLTTDSDFIMNTIYVNFLSAQSLLRFLIKPMSRRKFGRIVLGSSIGTKFGGGVNSYAYSLSKHMLEFMPSEMQSWAKKNILINTLRIGVTDTKIHKNLPKKNLKKRIELIPIGRLATPYEVANAIKWFGSDQNTYTTGQVIDISGGE
jgi:NAD(P)-dependent dehydrogenase (short-subunit alcohol dehydrogenase family)